MFCCSLLLPQLHITISIHNKINEKKEKGSNEAPLSFHLGVNGAARRKEEEFLQLLQIEKGKYYLEAIHWKMMKQSNGRHKIKGEGRKDGEYKELWGENGEKRKVGKV